MRGVSYRSAFGIAGLLCLLLAGIARDGLAAEVMPPLPRNHFNDYAGMVSPAVADQLNRTLEDFERQTSDQIVVAVFPKMESDSSIEDYTVRVAQSWKVGLKGTNNGAVLFVFIRDRKMYLQVGYGLEGALPDALARQIIENELKPSFRNGDYEGGLKAGVSAILSAVRGEYKGTGRTVADRNRGDPTGIFILLLFLGFFGVVVLLSIVRSRSGRIYRRSGYSSWHGWTTGSGSSGGGWGGGSSGGSFSGGGGSFGGGGAGGSW